MLVKKTEKNQLTLPKEIVGNFPDIEYFDISVKEGQIVLTPVRISAVDHNLEAIRNKMKRLGITAKDVKESVVRARKKQQ